MSINPDKRLADGIEIVQDAVVVPFGHEKSKGIKRPAGCFNAAGDYVPLSQCFRHSSAPTTFEPSEGPHDPKEKLSGTWIYGGLLYRHFGHCLLESTSRLWAIEHINGPIDGVVFLSKKDVTWPNKFSKAVEPIFNLFGAEFQSIKNFTTPFAVEKLVVAPQGYGTGDMIGGCPEYRDLVRRKFGVNVPASGAERIYISRSGLYSKRGRYLGENYLEKLFEASGYRVFHPQLHTLEEQVAQYKSAHTIVSSDSSALHLAAMCTESKDRIAIIQRRPSKIIGDFILQFDRFCGLKPDVIDAMTGSFFYNEKGNPKNQNEIISVLDIGILGQKLLDLGYIEDTTDWRTQFDFTEEISTSGLLEVPQK